MSLKISCSQAWLWQDCPQLFRASFPRLSIVNLLYPVPDTSDRRRARYTEVPPLFVNTFSAELMLRRKGGARCDGKQGVSSTSVPDVREHVRANTHPPCVSWVRVNQREQVYTNRSQSSQVIFEEQLCTLRAQSVAWESCVRAN